MYRYGVALALLAFLAAGCSDDGAGTLPPLSSSPSITTVSPSPTPTQGPAERVAAAARAYYAELTRAGQTGSTTALRAMVSPACGCTDAIEYIAKEQRAGHHFTTVYQVVAVKAHDVTDTFGSATVTVSYAPSQVVDARGRTVRKLPGASRVGRELGFRREGDRWLLSRYVLLGG